MFSGGIDSSGVLYTLVTDPDFRDRELIVHHIILQNRENRAQAEMDSVTQIVNYCQTHHADRPFTYTQSVFNTMGFAPLAANRFPYDMDVCAFTAANIAVARKDVRQIAMGRTKTDVGSGGTDFQQRMARAQQVFGAVYSLEKEAIPNYIFPVINMTKREIWDSLPPQIQQASWYCRHPQYQEDGSATPCKQCITCKEVAEFIPHA